MFSKTPAALATRFFLALAFVALAFILPAYGATCTDGQTQWRTTGCCQCNSGRQQTLWACHSGAWVNTGYSQCNVNGTCCAFPCCV